MSYYHEWWENARKQRALILTKPKERELLLKRIKELEVQHSEKETKLTRTIGALTLLANKRKEDLEREKEALLALAKQKISTKAQFKELLTKLEEEWKEEREQSIMEKDSLLTINQELSQENQQIIGKIIQTNNKLTTMITAIEGNTLGRDWKKLILNYLRTIQSQDLKVELTPEELALKENQTKKLKQAQEAIFELDNKLKEIEKTKEEEITQLQEQIEETNKQINEKKQTHNDLLNLQQDYEQLTREREQLKQELKNQQETNKQLLDKNKSLGNAYSEINALKSQNNSLTKRNQTYHDQIIKNERELNEKIVERDNEIRALKLDKEELLKLVEKEKKESQTEKDNELARLKQELVNKDQIISDKDTYLANEKNKWIREKGELEAKLKVKEEKPKKVPKSTIPKEPTLKETQYKNIHQDFTEELIKEWENKGFVFEQTRDWINTGFIPQDADLVNWLIRVKRGQYGKFEWWLNFSPEGEIKKVRKEYQIWKETK